MKLRDKKAHHISIIGMVVIYILISLSNIFLLPNLSVLNNLNTHVDKHSSFNMVPKVSELARQFKCILEDRKKVTLPTQVALVLNAAVVLTFLIALFRHFKLPVSIRYSLHQTIPIYLSVQVFRI